MLTEPQAHKVWDVIVEHVGANDSVPTDPLSMRSSFVRYATTLNVGEFHFSGPLGVGGKLYLGRRHLRCNGLRVNCYKEEETPERLAAIEKCNAQLTAMWKLWNGET